MRKVLIVACVIALAAILAGGTCIAGVPASISYQGKLTNTLGQLVSDGAYQVQFKLYVVSTVGTPFWTSAVQSVTTSGGVFTTQLSTLAASDLAGKTDVWMEIWVGTPLVALSPRTKFASVPYALISGDSWSLLGNAGTTPGTNFVGTTDNQALEFKVNNTRGLRLEPASGTINVIGGYSGNTVTSGLFGVTISGGGYSGYPNSVTSSNGTVGGGFGNTASGSSSTVGGGYSNTASGPSATIAGGSHNNVSGYTATVGGGSFGTASGSSSTVGGGDGNTASGSYTTVGGGYYNTASGSYATVGGGFENDANGESSFAAGSQAKAIHNGAFVWADATYADFASTANNQFLIRASGGVGIGTATPGYTLHVNGIVRGNAFVTTSDLRYKTNIDTISNPLDKVMQLRGVSFDWKKSEYPELAFGDGRQVGFVAQEIAQVLPEVVSKDNKGIYSVAYGSVVPVLVEALKEQQRTIESQQKQIDEIKALVAALVSKQQEKP